MEINIKGIISLEDLEAIKALNISSFSFDHRPKSFNFLQARIIEDILTQYPQLDYSIIFENESNFMINEIVKKLNDKASLNLEIVTFAELDKVNLLNGNISLYYYQDYNLSFYHSIKKLDKIIFPEESIKLLMEKNEFEPMIKLLKDELKQTKIELLLNWNFDLPSRFLQMKNIDSLSFEVNNDVQSGYRLLNIDIINKFFNTLDITGA